MNQNKGMARFWILAWGLGIIGQICWNVENQWFNTFVYAKIAKDPTIISWMVAISAIATTIATFVFGTASDRSGKRKPYIVTGYILWGIFTILFGTTEFITGGRTNQAQQVIMLAAVAVVLMDALMSFFGSMGSDAAYNAWMNDNMNSTNRGQIGAALATQPIIGTILGTVIGGMLIGGNDNYTRLFVTMGGLVIVFGLLSLLIMKDNPDLKPNREGSFWKQLMGAFNFRELSKRKELIWVFITLAVYFIAFDVYYPHMGNYLIYYLGFAPDSIGIIEGLALIVGMLIVIPTSRMINRNRITETAAISIVLSFVGIGILGLFVSPGNVDPSTVLNWNILIGLLFFGFGYVMFMQVISVWMKQLFPSDSKGQFEGFRIVFFVLLPWLISPFISNPIIKSTGRMMDSSGNVEYLPTDALFRISAVLILLTFVPLHFARRCRIEAVEGSGKDAAK